MQNLNCENLPKRISCQFLNPKKQKFELIQNYIKKNGKKKKKFFKNKKKLIFHLVFSKPQIKKNPIKIILSLPFGCRVIFKKLFFIMTDNFEKQKKKTFISFIKKKNAKIINTKLLEDKYKKILAKKLIFKNFNFLFEQKINNPEIIKISKLISKKGSPLFYFKIRKNFISSFVQAFSFLNYKIDEDFFFLKIECNNCPKKIKNNFFQTLGNIFDYIPLSFQRIDKILINTDKSSVYEIFLKNFFF